MTAVNFSEMKISSNPVETLVAFSIGSGIGFAVGGMIMADILALYDVDDIFGQVAGMVTDAFDGADHEHGVNGVSDIAGVFQ